MENYKDMVENLANARSTELIDNSSTEHASVLVREMFAHAGNSVKVFTGCLSKSIYERADVIEAAKSFISRNGKLTILVQDEEAEDKLQEHKFIGEVQRSVGRDAASFVVLKINPGLGSVIKSHFLVVDDTAFRFEPDKEKHEAVASFNNPQLASQLSTLFDQMSKYSIDLKIA